jgi:hypothetical protein
MGTMLVPPLSNVFMSARKSRTVKSSSGARAPVKSVRMRSPNRRPDRQGFHTSLQAEKPRARYPYGTLTKRLQAGPGGMGLNGSYPG